MIIFHLIQIFFLLILDTEYSQHSFILPETKQNQQKILKKK